MGYDDTIERVKQNIDIVEYVGRKVSLKRSGSNYKGLCPFHNEKTPSFMVSPEKQIFTCFGCGETGDVIKFVQKTEALDFREALEKLAGEAGVEINTAASRTDEKKERLYDISTKAARHFYKSLRNGDNPGLRYVVARGISPETAVKFGIGYAPDAWQDLDDFIKAGGLDENAAFEAGLLSKSKKGGFYDKFRNRVIFPIINTKDKVIGFGGRAIDDTMPKYLNSPETLIFKKKDNLYGLNLAKKTIREKNLALVVEGYMDVVSLVEAGVENTVASLGTALTIEQARLLKRYTDTVVLSYDSDSAGQAATMRGIDILRAAGLKVKILRIEGGKDPDEFIRKQGKAAFDKLINEAVPFMQYKIDIIKQKYDLSDTEGSISFLEEISGELKKITSSVELAAYIKMVSDLTKIPESSIRREVEESGKAQSPGPELIENRGGREKEAEAEAGPVISRKKSPVVRTLIKLMLGNSSFVPIIRDTKEFADYFINSGYEGAAKLIFDTFDPEKEIVLKDLEDRGEENDLRLLRDIDKRVLAPADERQTLVDCAARIQNDSLNSRRRDILKILEVLDEEEDKEEINRLSAELIAINRAIEAVKQRKEQLNG